MLSEQQKIASIGEGVRELEPAHRWWGCETGQPLESRTQVQRNVLRLGKATSGDAAHRTEGRAVRYVQPRVIAALLTMHKAWNQPKRPWGDDG